jgi:ethanolamine ammonia-lyase small subunit
VNEVDADPWRALRRLTPARIALGRAGESLPTDAVLEFGLAHARARDAVHAVLDADALGDALLAAGFASLRVHSAAADRAEYLRRPDLGRRLAPQDAARLDARRVADRASPDVVFMVADGLSATAVARHAVPLLAALAPRLSGWQIGPIVIATQGRVALGDAVGERLGARLIAVLIGERPGLSSPDSLGAYLTHAPRVGRVDAERNCLSNIRPQGLTCELAAERLAGLMTAARRLGRSGLALTEEGAARVLE